MKLDQIEDDQVAEEMIDTAVNMSPMKAVEICQKAVNYLGTDSWLIADGVMGRRRWRG